MASTLSGIYLSDLKSKLFSIGNTRVYLLQSGKYLKQLTDDDTTLNYLISTKQLLHTDVDSYERKNEITACFGGGSKTLFDIKFSTIGPIVAPIIITSDGIHDYVTVDQMEDIIDEYGFSKKTCMEMFDTAINNGSYDDISIVLGFT